MLHPNAMRTPAAAYTETVLTIAGRFSGPHSGKPDQYIVDANGFHPISARRPRPEAVTRQIRALRFAHARAVEREKLHRRFIVTGNIATFSWPTTGGAF